MFLRICKISLLLFLSFAFLSGCHSESSATKKVGIIIPIEHKAMNEIVAGFTDTLSKEFPQPIKFKIMNAQGDLNLQRSIIQQMKDEHYDLIVPIGLGPTQMAVAMTHNQPIVSLAATFSEQERSQLKKCNITVVHDEISPQQIIDFVHKTYPKITHLTLIHSASDKIFPDVKIAVTAGKKVGIEIQPMMVPTLSELYSISNALPSGTQGILVLKDNLIVSGISTLSIAAQKKEIPLITSDQGSVQDGAAFALGVHERHIGIAGAKLASAVLGGQPVCSLPIVDMTQLTLFVNKSSLLKEKQSFEILRAAAGQQHYELEVLS